MADIDRLLSPLRFYQIAIGAVGREQIGLTWLRGRRIVLDTKVSLAEDIDEKFLKRLPAAVQISTGLQLVVPVHQRRFEHGDFLVGAMVSQFWQVSVAASSDLSAHDLSSRLLLAEPEAPWRPLRRL